MNIENQETYIQCENSKCGLYLRKIKIDIDQYAVIIKRDNFQYTVHFELPHFYCAECFNELIFYIRGKL